MNAVAKRTRARKKKGNRLNSLAVIVIVIGFIFILGSQIRNMEQEDKELAAQEDNLSAIFEQESMRTVQLEEQKIFIQTKQYIEEEAKRLGFVYPDEIIFKPSN